MKKYLSTFIILLGFIILLPACTTTPFSNRSQFLLISLDEEMASGLTAWQSIQKENKESTDRKKREQVLRVGQRLAAAANQEKFTWEFKVFADTQANAFCLPGGKIAIYEGLFPYIADDDELAVVISHEIAHAVLRHGAERAQAQALAELGKEGLKKATTNENYIAAYGVVSQLGMTLPYSRKHEYEADKVGLQIMAIAGYNPQKALDFWQKFGKEENATSTSEFFSTHPISSNRIKRIEQVLPDLLPIYEENKK